MSNINPDDITEPISGVFRIPIPVPLPLKYLYSYAIALNQDYLVLDLGMDTPQARDAWMKATQHLGLEHGRVRAVFLTHFHPDHVGLADFAADLWQAPLFMWKQELETVYRLFDESPKSLMTFFSLHGMPQDMAEYLDQERFFTQAVVHLPVNPRIQPLDPLTTWGPFQLLDQAGHTDHQLLLYWPERQLLFTGDQVLARITPNISFWPDTDPDPLASYLESLRKLQMLPVRLGLPAHEGVINDVGGRIDELIKHHNERAGRILDLLSVPRTAFETAQHLFKRDLTRSQWRFALSETLAHLEYLRVRNLATFYEVQGIGRYQAVR